MNKWKKYSDNDLIELVRLQNKHSSRAFSELYDRYATQVRHYLNSLAGREMAKDLFQETWTDYYRGIIKSQVEDTAALLFVIAKRKYINYLERHKANLVINVENIEDYYNEIVGEDDVQINFPDFKTKLDFIINNYLEPGVKEAFILRKLHNMDYSEIAIHCGCTEEAARQKVSRAVKKVRLIAKQIINA